MPSNWTHQQARDAMFGFLIIVFAALVFILYTIPNRPLPIFGIHLYTLIGTGLATLCVAAGIFIDKKVRRS